MTKDIAYVVVSHVGTFHVTFDTVFRYTCIVLIQTAFRIEPFNVFSLSIDGDTFRYVNCHVITLAPLVVTRQGAFVV